MLDDLLKITCNAIKELARRFTMPNHWRRYIVSSPKVLKGKPRIKGTRIPVGLILGYLAAGYPDANITAEFPDIKDKHISACLAYARELSDYEVAVS